MTKRKEELMAMEKKHITEEGDHQQKRRSIQPPLQCPWLLLPRTGKNEGYICCTSPLYRGYSTRFFSDLRINRVFNCCFGWLILSNYQKRLFLWNPVKSRLVQLPPLELKPNEEIKYAVLMSSPTKEIDDDLDSNYMIMLFQYEYSDTQVTQFCIRYLFLAEKEREPWNSVCYDDEPDRRRLRGPIIFNGSVYALRGFELVSINHGNSSGIITITSYADLPEFSPSICPDQYLVESCGDLFCILIYWADSKEEDIVAIEVFKLDQVSKIWNKVVREVGDRVFFFNRSYCISSCSKTKGGYMCYVSHASCCLYSYSLEDNTISATFLPTMFNLPKAVFGYYSAIPYLPHLNDDGPAVQINLVESGLYKAVKSKIKEEPEDVKVYKQMDKGGEESLLYGFPYDLFTFITTTLLNPVDYLNFRSTSRTCRLCAPPVDDFAHAPPLSSPWLMVTDNHSKIYSFVDSELGGQYFKNIPKPLVDTRIICSNNGWLLISTKSIEKFSLYNPLTSQTVELPEPPALTVFIQSWNVGLSSAPTSSKCIVVLSILDIGEIYFLVVGSKNWRTHMIDRFFRDSNHCPVFHDGCFWFLGHCIDGGRLGAFKVEDDGQVSWNVLVITKEDRFDDMFKRFLVSCAESLLLVAIGKLGELVEVFVLNQNKACWEKVYDLGNHALYLCRWSSLSIPVRAKWMSNVVFLPRVVCEDGLLHKDRTVYYSMDTGKYHTLVNNKQETVEYRDTEELLLSNWIEPSWSRN